MWLRPLRVMVGAAFRADPLRALANTLFVPFGLLLATLFGLWQKLAVDALVLADHRQLMTAAVLFGGSVALSALTTAVSAKVRVELEERVGLQLERTLIEASTCTPYVDLHERPDFQDRLELLRDGRRRLGQPVTAMCLLLGAFAPAAGTLLLLASIHPALLMMVLLVVPNIITSRRAVVRTRRVDEQCAPQRRQARHVVDLLTSPNTAKEIRLTGAQDPLLRRHSLAYHTVTAQVRRAQLRSDAEAAAVRGLFALGFAGAMVFLVHRILQGSSTIGDLVLALSVIRRTTADLAFATNSTGQFSQQVETIRRLLWLRDHSREQTSTAPQGALLAGDSGIGSGGVQVRELSFMYPGTDRRVLDRVRLDIPAGAVVAVVGENGAGKSTLVKLLAALYQPDSGDITVGGHDLRKVSPSAWQHTIGAVFQDYLAPHLTLREAVAIGGDGASATDEQVLAALTMAGADDLLTSDGLTLDTQLGPPFGGPELSRGQWQKVAIARASLRGPVPLLVLDEPSASLDPLSEAAVFDRYGSLVRQTSAAGGNTLIVSHRLALVQTADVVVFMQHGRVASVGTHQELLARAPDYAELFHLQARGYL